jgi:hypothetical protein
MKIDALGVWLRQALCSLVLLATVMCGTSSPVIAQRVSALPAASAPTGQELLPCSIPLGGTIYASKSCAAGALSSAMTGAPSNTRVCAEGDSRFNDSVDAATATGVFRNLGPLAWLRAISRQRYDMEPAQDMAIAGSVSADVLGRLPAELAANDCGTWLIDGFINDPANTVAWSTTLANMQAIQAAVLNAGRILVWHAGPLRGSTTYSATALSSANLAAMNRQMKWLKDQPLTHRNVYTVDYAAAVSDPLSTIGYNIDSMTRDGIHTLPVGGYTEALADAPVLNALFQPRNLLAASNSDLYDAVNNPTGALNANPMLDGTTGTVSGTCSGSLATSYICATGSGTTGATFTASKVTVNGKACQRITFAGTPATNSTTDSVEIRQSINAKVSPGDVVDGYMDLTWTGITGVITVSPRVQASLSGTLVTPYGADIDLRNPGYYMPTTVSGLLFKPRFTVPASGYDDVQAKVLIYMDGTALGGTLDLCGFTVRKVKSVGGAVQ